jgi:hypothetical protein
MKAFIFFLCLSLSLCQDQYIPPLDHPLWQNKTGRCVFKRANIQYRGVCEKKICYSLDYLAITKGQCGAKWNMAPILYKTRWSTKFNFL